MIENPAVLFLDTARKFPDALAVYDEESKLKFRDLSRLVLLFAEHMQVCGVKQHSLVAVHTTDSSIIVVSALACALLGATWVFADEALESSDAINPTHMLVTSDAIPDNTKLPIMLVDEAWLKRPLGIATEKAPFFPGFASASDDWLLFHSSGTTGRPKFMALSCETQLRRFRAIQHEFTPGVSKCVFLFAANSAPSLMRGLAGLCWGAAWVFSTDPHFWVDSAVTHVFGSPQQIGYLLSGVPFSKKLGKALIGGDGMPDNLASDLLDNFDVVVNTYGSTEANLIVENQKLRNADGSISTRTIWYDSEIEIVDEDDTPLSSGQEGIVRVRNPYLVKRYIGADAAQQAAFRDGWFYPGDRGVLDQERNFTICGRLNDRLNIGGVKINAVLLDYIMREIEGVEDAISFEMPDADGRPELIAFIKVRPGSYFSDIQKDITIQIAANLGNSAVPSRIIDADVIPRTENGKPNRSACIALVTQARDAQKAAK